MWCLLFLWFVVFILFAHVVRINTAPVYNRVPLLEYAREDHEQIRLLVPPMNRKRAQTNLLAATRKKFAEASAFAARQLLVFMVMGVYKKPDDAPAALPTFGARKVEPGVDVLAMFDENVVQFQPETIAIVYDILRPLLLQDKSHSRDPGALFKRFGKVGRVKNTEELLQAEYDDARKKLTQTQNELLAAFWKPKTGVFEPDSNQLLDAPAFEDSNAELRALWQLLQHWLTSSELFGLEVSDSVLVDGGKRSVGQTKSLSLFDVGEGGDFVPGYLRTVSERAKEWASYLPETGLKEEGIELGMEQEQVCCNKVKPFPC